MGAETALQATLGPKARASPWPSPVLSQDPQAGSQQMLYPPPTPSPLSASLPSSACSRLRCDGQVPVKTLFLRLVPGNPLPAVAREGLDLSSFGGGRILLCAGSRGRLGPREASHLLPAALPGPGPSTGAATW